MSAAQILALVYVTGWLGTAVTVYYAEWWDADSDGEAAGKGIAFGLIWPLLALIGALFFVAVQVTRLVRKVRKEATR